METVNKTHTRGDTMTQWSVRIEDEVITDFSGYGVRLQLRSFTDGTLIHEWSTAAVNVSIATNIITFLAVPYASTEGWPVDAIKLVGDMETTSPGGVRYTWFKVEVIVEPDETR